MRWLYLSVILVLAAVVLVFAFQNFSSVRVLFLGYGMEAPLAVLIVTVYIVGAATGGSALALLRRLNAGAKRHA